MWPTTAPPSRTTEVATSSRRPDGRSAVDPAGGGSARAASASARSRRWSRSSRGRARNPGLHRVARPSVATTHSAPERSQTSSKRACSIRPARCARSRTCPPIWRASSAATAARSAEPPPGADWCATTTTVCRSASLSDGTGAAASARQARSGCRCSGPSTRAARPVARTSADAVVATSCSAIRKPGATRTASSSVARSGQASRRTRTTPSPSTSSTEQPRSSAPARKRSKTSSASATAAGPGSCPT